MALVLCRVGLLVMFPVQVGVVWPLLRLLHTLAPLAVGTPERLAASPKRYYLVIVGGCSGYVFVC